MNGTFAQRQEERLLMFWCSRWTLDMISRAFCSHSCGNVLLVLTVNKWHEVNWDINAKRKMATETEPVHIFGFSCYCFSSAFRFPLLRFPPLTAPPPPPYISQHIIGWRVCECVYLEPWDEECGYPLVWPGTQGHLTLSFSVKTKFHLKYNLTHQSSYLLSPTVPSPLLSPAGALCFWVGQRPWGQHKIILSEHLCEETTFGPEASGVSFCWGIWCSLGTSQD